MSPAPGVNVIYGANGQGKSSLLEGIYYLAFLRSFRTRRPAEMIRWTTADFQVTGTIIPVAASGSVLERQTLSAGYAENRQLSRNGKTVTAAVDFINSFLCVALVPEDLVLIKGSPLYRRRYMDMLLCQISRQYLQELIQYNRTLSQRNALLKDVRRFGEKAVRAFDQILAQSGARLTAIRALNISLLGNLFSKIYSELTGFSCEANLEFVSSVFRRQSGDVSVDHLTRGMLDCLEKEFVRDSERRTTRFGPHRDDLDVQLQGKSLSVFGSEGQCRLGALVLKLAALELLKAQTGQREVVLLIDDVFGELDTCRREAFFKSVSRADQVLLACTSVPAELAAAGMRFTMADGKLSGEKL